MRRFPRWILILLWTIGILFPMAFLAALWPAFGTVFNAIFSPGWMHVLMHGWLYSVLGFLLAQWIVPLSARPIIVVGLCLLVGCLHEGLQLLTAGVWPGWPAEITDLTVDLIGAAIGVGAQRMWVHLKNSGRIGKRAG